MDTPSEGDGEVRIPVTVLTGVLGAGKTTLLRYILEKPHGYRVAVIQNEFSEEMGMEAPLFTDAKGDTIKDVYELPNGCLCCSAKDGLIGMLDVLLEQKDRFDYVLVEATGIADPESVCEVFWVDDGLGSRVYLDGVLALVDAYHVFSYLGKSEAEPEAEKGKALGLEAEALKQVACADVLILNKVDLVSEDRRSRACAVLREINPTARMLESRFAEVPLGEILGLQAFDKDRLAAAVLAIPAMDGQEPGHEHAHSHSDGHGHCNCEGILPRAHGIESVLLHGEDGALYDPDKVRSWMADVLWEGSAGFVYRCKGLFRGPSEEEAEPRETVAHALQGVGKLFEIEEAKVSSAGSKLLFVGRGLKRDALAAGLQKCQADT
ncbi:unnamed protein product [Effrenium voratum]|uniref:COBW domain-containing protein 1 n=1 Tax=Effrenium voratum TaxID=2562239 RepID=A0AA36MRZ8_9DINO|nr:unnamed protein product [Effrenium voratum]CAJ1383505.1 unnamed protein product [Effrenium voratum]CAJ1424397.1 unnamed protein product [Effrenium voratum]